MNKTILITGAPSGVGSAFARLFAASGCNAIAAMREPERGGLSNRDHGTLTRSHFKLAQS